MTSNAIYIKINRVFKTPRQIQKGLMFLKNILKKAGALFCMPQTKIHKFWMKNTYIPLDIVWINEFKKVVYINKNSQPCGMMRCSAINPGINAKYVLEINAGLSDKLGLKIGDAIDFNK